MCLSFFKVVRKNEKKMIKVTIFLKSDNYYSKKRPSRNEMAFKKYSNVYAFSLVA